MSRIYNAYLEGEDRDFAIMEAESNMIFNKLFAMLEMVDIKLELNKEAAEYKVLQESGTYEDLQYLYTEAENEANQEKQGIIQTIIGAIKNIVSSISNSIKNFFSKNKSNPNNMIEVDGEAWDKMSKVESLWQKIQPAFSNPKNALITITSGIAAFGGLTWGSQKIIKKVKESDRDALVQKVDNINKQLQEKLNNIVPDFLKNTMKEVWGKIKEIPSFISQGLSKLGIPIGKKNNENPTETPETNNNNNPNVNNTQPTNESTFDEELIDSDLDSFLEKFLSGDFDDSLFEEEVDDNIRLTEDEVENITIGGIPLKDQIVLQESVTDNDIISEEEISELNSIFESLENEEIDEEL